ncbi:Angio-associated migratory cell protein [Plecturocebus cupreus]
MSGLLKVWQVGTEEEVWSFEVRDLEWTEWMAADPKWLSELLGQAAQCHQWQGIFRSETVASQPNLKEDEESESSSVESLGFCRVRLRAAAGFLDGTLAIYELSRVSSSVGTGLASAAAVGGRHCRGSHLQPGRGLEPLPQLARQPAP